MNTPAPQELQQDIKYFAAPSSVSAPATRKTFLVVQEIYGDMSKSSQNFSIISPSDTAIILLHSDIQFPDWLESPNVI